MHVENPHSEHLHALDDHHLLSGQVDHIENGVEGRKALELVLAIYWSARIGAGGNFSAE